MVWFKKIRDGVFIWEISRNNRSVYICINENEFDSLGFELVGLFDVEPNKIGQCINGIPVLNLECLQEVMQKQTIHIAIVAVPEQSAQEVADRLVSAGIRGIWNFAPRKIQVPDTVRIVNQDLSVGLNSLSYHLARQAESQ